MLHSPRHGQSPYRLPKQRHDPRSTQRIRALPLPPQPRHGPRKIQTLSRPLPLPRPPLPTSNARTGSHLETPLEMAQINAPLFFPFSLPSFSSFLALSLPFLAPLCVSATLCIPLSPLL